MGAGSKGHILIVETGCSASRVITECLRADDFSVAVAKDLMTIDLARACKAPDIIVLDFDKPNDHGFDLCMKLRNQSTVPIILTAAQGSDLDRILGLEIGADDYLTRPFNPRELLARIHAILRRVRMAQSIVPSQTVSFAGWTLNRRLRSLTDPQGGKVILTSAEFDLLALFCDFPGRLLSRAQLLELARRRGSNANGRSIDVAVSRLRAKIELSPHAPCLIKTIRARGYMFMGEVSAETGLGS